MECSMPRGRLGSAFRRAGRRDRAGWQREGVVIAVVGEAAVGKTARGASLWVVCGGAER